MNLYIVWRVSRRDPRFELVRGWGVAVGAWGGTRFVGANLAGANFGRATLPHASFVGADIGRVHWFGAKKFELARFGPSHSALRNRQVEQLLLTGAGAGVNFDGLDLHGLHLGGADLQGASLIGCNLNEAVLAHANLSAAKLKQTQLDGADLGGANLTGATIEDWGITRSTHLQEVRCEYIYLRLPTRAGETPLRKPDDLNKTFEPGDFSAFIQPMVETLDLYFNKGVQPQVMAAAYKVVSEANPEAEMEIVAMENRGGGAVLMRVKTSPEADKSMLSQQFHAEYQGMQTQLASREQQLLLKDAQIEILQNTITGIAVPQRFYPDPQRELSPELLLLHGKLEAYFSLDDLRQIAFELRTDDESIGGATKPAYAREMLKYFDRRGRIAELVGVCRAARPDVAW